MGLAGNVRSELDQLTAQLIEVADAVGRTGDDMHIDARSLHETGAGETVRSIARRLDDQGAQLRRLQARLNGMAAGLS